MQPQLFTVFKGCFSTSSLDKTGLEKPQNLRKKGRNIEDERKQY